jgi:hypothetical protein
MKTLVVLTLLAAMAAAEPFFFGRGWGGRRGGYGGWGRRSGYRGGYRRYGKREAEAEADPQVFLTNGLYNSAFYNNLYSTNAYTPYYSALTTYPYAWNYGRVYGKREAEDEETMDVEAKEMEAEPEMKAMTYYPYYYGHQHYYNPVSYINYPVYAASHYYHPYTYTTANYVHAIGKREAEAEADPFFFGRRWGGYRRRGYGGYRRRGYGWGW